MERGNRRPERARPLPFANRLVDEAAGEIQRAEQKPRVRIVCIGAQRRPQDGVGRCAAGKYVQRRQRRAAPIVGGGGESCLLACERAIVREQHVLRRRHDAWFAHRFFDRRVFALEQIARVRPRTERGVLVNEIEDAVRIRGEVSPQLAVRTRAPRARPSRRVLQWPTPRRSALPRTRPARGRKRRSGRGCSR